MKFKNFTNNSHWFFLILYFTLIFFLVQVEKTQADSNIKNIFDGFWYSIVTLTTVGYGDYYPISPIGKILGLFIILSSLGLLGFLIGSITSIINNRMEKKKQGFFGTDYTNHFVIVGWNEFGKQVTDQIVNANCKVAVVTNNKNDLDLIYDLYDKEKVFVLFADYKNMEALNKVNIKEANSVYVNFNDDSESLVYVINLKKYYDSNIVVALNSTELKETYNSIGVKYIVSKTEITSRLVASYIFEPDVACFTEDLMATSIHENDYDMQEYKVTEDNPYLNNDYLDAFIEVKKQHDCILVGLTKIEDNKRILLKNPSKGVKIELNDYLLLISNSKGKKEIEEIFGSNEGIID